MNNPNGGNWGESWMGEANEPLQGFSWRSGVERDTSGIVMWSDIFLHTVEDTGERIAILVIDTQGLFDNQTTTADNFKMFALGSLLSSIQVLNLSQRIQEDQLHHLHFATDYAQCIGNTKDSNVFSEKPFQKLTFLIRDFPNPKQYPFGIDGGKQYLHKVLNDIKSNQNPELQSVRQHISDTFDQTDCCLLPRPDETICEDHTYDGRWSEMSDRFRDNLKEIIEYLLLPNNLITKKINGIEITGRMMKNYVDSYFQLIKSNNIQIRSFADATIENYMSDLIEKCVSKYDIKKLKLNDIDNLEEIPDIHEKCKKKVLEIFDKEKKLGNFEHVKKFKKKLMEKIKVMYREWKENVVLMALEEQKNAKPDQAKEIMNKLINFATIAGIAILSIEAPIAGFMAARAFISPDMLSVQPVAKAKLPALAWQNSHDKNYDSD